MEYWRNDRRPTASVYYPIIVDVVFVVIAFTELISGIVRSGRCVLGFIAPL